MTYETKSKIKSNEKVDKALMNLAAAIRESYPSAIQTAKNGNDYINLARIDTNNGLYVFNSLLWFGTPKSEREAKKLEKEIAEKMARLEQLRNNK